MDVELNKIMEQMQSLEPHERAGLTVLIDKLQQRYGKNLRRVALFGSKVRGDFDDESDLDILIILRMEPGIFRSYWNEIVNIVWDVELKYGFVTSLVIKDENEYERLRESQILLSRNLEREGIVLWMNQPSSNTSGFDSRELKTT